MRNGKVLKIVSIFCLMLLLSFVTVAYALLSQNLSISGSGEVKNAGWDIHFANVAATATGNASFELPKINPTANTTLEDFKVNLTSPSDSVTFTFDVVNGGGIDAIIKSVTKPSTTNGMTCQGLSSQTGTNDGTKLCGNLKFDLAYYTKDSSGTVVLGEAVAANQDLKGTVTKQMALKVSLNSSSSSNVPVDDVKVTGLKLSIVYNQTT